MWFSRVILWLMVVLQLSGNGTMAYLLVYKVKHSLANKFILSLACSDLLSGLGSIIGAYRGEIGLTPFFRTVGSFGENFLVRNLIV